MEVLKTPVEIMFDGVLMTAVIRGDIDHHTAKPVRESIDRELLIRHPQRLVLDLTGIELMDSAGLGLILGRYNKALEAGCTFAVKNPGLRIMRILKMSGADRVITIEK